MAFIAFKRTEIVQISSVGQLVDVDDEFIMLIEPSDHKIRTDKPAPPVTKIVIATPCSKKCQAEAQDFLTWFGDKFQSV